MSHADDLDALRRVIADLRERLEASEAARVKLEQEPRTVVGVAKLLDQLRASEQARSRLEQDLADFYAQLGPGLGPGTEC